MAEQGGFKYNIIWAVLGVIAILATVKKLGFTPRKITTPGVSVELKGGGGIAPKAADGAPTPTPDNTVELTARVKELESQLKSGQSAEHSAPAEAAANSGRPVNPNPPAETASVVNVAGAWVGPVMLNIRQNGSATATVSADGQQLNVTDFGKGFPQYFTFNRQ